MTHAVAAWPPDRSGGIVVGKTTHVWCPRVRGRPCYLLLQSAVVACVGNPGSIWGDVRSLRACMVLQCITHTYGHTLSDTDGTRAHTSHGRGTRRHVAENRELQLNGIEIILIPRAPYGSPRRHERVGPATIQYSARLDQVF